MAKIQRISQFQFSLSFLNSQDHFSLLYQEFLESNLGKVYQAIPWSDLAKGLHLKDSPKGPSTIFSPEGKIALMFLKNYSCCSDQRLIEQLNGNIYYQMFCGLLFLPGQKITNFKIVSQIRCELAANLDIGSAQACLAKHWLPYMEELDKATVDATCYESSLRYPTDQKLLWESVDWCYRELSLMCKLLKTKRPRTKYLKWKERYLAYGRKRRKPSKERRVLTRGLLNLLFKLLEELGDVQDKCPMPERYHQRIATIKKVYGQQRQLFTTGKKPSGRIVSISKSYIRPIVRGKETKKVEFGAKVNKLQIDGISFIEHLSFDAFNEGTRFKSSAYLSQSLTRKTLKVLGADAIFATNENRRFATANNIRTDFCRKGRAGKHERHRKLMAKMIAKERASRLEGSFGKEKENYHLKRIKARNQPNEILWIFCGIHVANAFEIGRRMQTDDSKLSA